MDDGDFDLERELLLLETAADPAELDGSVESQANNENVEFVNLPSLSGRMPKVSLGETGGNIVSQFSAGYGWNDGKISIPSSKHRSDIPGPAGKLPLLNDERKAQLVSMRRKVSSAEMLRFLGVSTNDNSKSDGNLERNDDSAAPVNTGGTLLNALRSKLGVGDFRLYQVNNSSRQVISGVVVVEIKEVISLEANFFKLVIRDETAEVLALYKSHNVIPEPGEIIALTNVFNFPNFMIRTYSFLGVYYCL